MITWDAFPAVPAGTARNPRTGRQVKRPAEPSARVSRLAFDLSGRRLLSVPASKFNTAHSVVYDPIRVWDNTGALLREFVAVGLQVVNVGVAAAFLPGGDRLVVASSEESAQNVRDGEDADDVVKVWDVNTGETLASAPAPRKVSDLTCLPNGHVLLVTPNTVWRLAADLTSPAVKIPGRPQIPPKATRLTVSPTGDRFAAVGKIRATVWAGDGVALASRDHSKSPQNGPGAFRPHTTVLAVGHGTVVDLWDYATGAELTLVGHKRPVWGIGFGPDGRTVYTAASDGVVIVWDADTGAVRQKYDFGTGKLYSATVSPDGLTLALGGEDGRITVVDLDG